MPSAPHNQLHLLIPGKVPMQNLRARSLDPPSCVLLGRGALNTAEVTLMGILASLNDVMPIFQMLKDEHV